MIKAGLIGAVFGFIYVTTLTLLSPFCTLCFTPLLGIGTGYLAGWFDTPPNPETSVRKGGIAGAISGAGAVLGQMLATVVNAILITSSEQLPILIREFGLSQFLITDTGEYWQATLTTNTFCGLLNLLIMAGLGAAGGMLWFQRQHRKTFPAVSLQ